ncbi:MAG: DUF3299 domain-containing protein [Pirellulales bacterium]
MPKPTHLAECFVASLLAAASVGCSSESPAEPLPATRTASTKGAATGTPTTSTATASTAAARPALPKPKLLPGARTRVLEAAGDRDYDKTFDDLRFEIAVGDPFHRDMLPDSIEDMAGKQIRIRGFILPTPQKRGIKQFVLVRDNQECCFGPGAALFDCILVDMNEGQAAEYTIRPVAVTGVFDIQEVVVDGRHWAIYHIASDTVK